MATSPVSYEATTSKSPTGSVFYEQADRIEEILNRNVDVFLPSLDPVWRNSLVSSQGVKANDDLGRDFKVIKIFMEGLTGVVEQGGPRDDFVLYGDNTESRIGHKLATRSVSNTFPDALQGMHHVPYRLGCPLRSMVGNIAFTLGEYQAEATPAFIGQIIGPKLEGYARNWAHQLCNYAYLSQNDYYAITNFGTGTIGTASTSILQGFKQSAGSGDYDTMILDLTKSNYAVDRLPVGTRINIYKTSSTAALVSALDGGGSDTTTVFVVTANDPLTGKVEIMASDGSALASGANQADTTMEMVGTNTDFDTVAGDEMVIIYAGSAGGTATTPYSSATNGYFTGIAGLNSWLKFGGSTDADKYLLGYERDQDNEIDVETFPQFKSLKKDLGGKPLTEHFMRQLMRRWHSAKWQTGQTVDTLIASDGVWLAYEAQKIGREYIDRTGRMSNIRNEGTSGQSGLGENEFSMTFDGRTYSGATSTYVESGTVYGIKRGGNNWKRIVPPEYDGLRRDSRQEAFVPFRFVVPKLYGTNSIMAPILDTSGNTSLITEHMQAPGMLRMQLMPDQPAGIKLVNCGEDRLYSD